MITHRLYGRQAGRPGHMPAWKPLEESPSLETLEVIKADMERRVGMARARAGLRRRRGQRGDTLPGDLLTVFVIRTVGEDDRA